MLSGTRASFHLMRALWAFEVEENGKRRAPARSPTSPPSCSGAPAPRADRHGIDWIEFVEAGVEALPFKDRSFDLVATYTGLHCFPDPAAAIGEMARVLRPGGELRGTSVIRRAGPARTR
jgi:SAM-dependent methyltransferase